MAKRRASDATQIIEGDVVASREEGAHLRRQQEGLAPAGARTVAHETPDFVRGGLVTGLYNQKAVWPIFGYEGSSFEFGGYIDRGFDDINWL